MTATLEMKLAKKGPLNPNQPKDVADLKFGMSSVNKSGVQQNTTCLFDVIEFEKPKIKKLEVAFDSEAHLTKCKGHCGHRKPHIDQKNPYIQCKKKLSQFSKSLAILISIQYKQLLSLMIILT